MKWCVWTSFGVLDNIASPNEVEAETAEEAEEKYRDMMFKLGCGCDYVCGVEPWEEAMADD